MKNLLKIDPQKIKKIEGEYFLPGDKSCAIRALVLSAMFAKNPVNIHNLPKSDDIQNTKQALIDLGCDIVDYPTYSKITPPKKFRETSVNIDSSRTAFVLLLALGLALNIKLKFFSSGGLRVRSQSDIIELATRFGCEIESNNNQLPIAIKRGVSTYPEEIILPGSAQYKTVAILLSLSAKSEVKFYEPSKSRDHTERMLGQFGWKCYRQEDNKFSFKPSKQKNIVTDIFLGGDPSSAAFLAVAATFGENNPLFLRKVNINSLRLGYLYVLPINIAVDNVHQKSNELIGDIIISPREESRRKAFSTLYSNENALIDEYPILAAASAFCMGESILQFPERLSNKESNRIEAIKSMLDAFKVKFKESENKLIIKGNSGVKNTLVEFRGCNDHRILMSAIVMAILANNILLLENHSYINTSFPEFFKYFGIDV